MTDTRETVVSWLRDAHAMEASAVNNIEKNLDNFEGYPTVQQILRDDLEVSRRNGQELETALERLDAQIKALCDRAAESAAGGRG